jgi:hypothetical protein
VYKDGGDVYEFLWERSTNVSTCLEWAKKMSLEAGSSLAAHYIAKRISIPTAI